MNTNLIWTYGVVVIYRMIIKFIVPVQQSFKILQLYEEHTISHYVFQFILLLIWPFIKILNIFPLL